jgi:two-component system NtrC family sensor kinase
MRFHRLLSFKLFLIILLVLTILTVGFSLYYIQIETAQYEEVARQCAERTSEIIANSTQNAMLNNIKENAYEIIRNISKQETIEYICLFNKNGEMVFSTDSSENITRVSIENRACAPCHESSGEVKGSMENSWHHIYRDEKEYRVLNYIRPILNDHGCYTASCHVHPADKTYLGVLCVIMSLEALDESVSENQARLISTNVAITLSLGLLVGILIWIFVHVPVRKLIMGTKHISSGNLDYRLATHRTDEIGVLEKSFNQMGEDLSSAKKEITLWSNELEQRVQDKTKELEKTQKRNLHIEKMASLGQLSATVAHELNNPISGILTYSKLIQKKLSKDNFNPDEKSSILKYLKMIESESARSGNIVKNMLLFSRQESLEIKPRQINRVIDASIDLISHHLDLHNIKLERNYNQELPDIEIDENQIKQALLALFVNAVEAMEDEGILTIRTELHARKKEIWICVQDTGKGISDDVKSQIIEPFFTTKDAVRGVGLGLSSVYAIIQRHGGEIIVESELEKGTAFIIKLGLQKRQVDKQ